MTAGLARAPHIYSGCLRVLGEMASWGVRSLRCVSLSLTPMCSGPDLERHLVDGAHRQAQLSRGLPMETRRRRLIMWLQRRGHDWDTISKLLETVGLS